jgi:formaldehyde-activating enzyme involved in methanogenesis
MRFTPEEIERMIQQVEFGKKAEVVKEVVDAIAEGIIERCKNEFSTMPLIDYQNIDNRQVFMLQLEMKVARDFKTAINTAILNGEEAEATLLANSQGGE